MSELEMLREHVAIMRKALRVLACDEQPGGEEEVSRIAFAALDATKASDAPRVPRPPEAGQTSESPQKGLKEVKRYAARGCENEIPSDWEVCEFHTAQLNRELDAAMARAEYERNAHRGPRRQAAKPDPLHPTGRCTCAGEGQCEWCLTLSPQTIEAMLGDVPRPDNPTTPHTCPFGSPGFFPNCNACVLAMQQGRSKGAWGASEPLLPCSAKAERKPLRPVWDVLSDRERAEARGPDEAGTCPSYTEQRLECTLPADHEGPHIVSAPVESDAFKVRRSETATRGDVRATPEEVLRIARAAERTERERIVAWLRREVESMRGQCGLEDRATDLDGTADDIEAGAHVASPKKGPTA